MGDWRKPLGLATSGVALATAASGLPADDARDVPPPEMEGPFDEHGDLTRVRVDQRATTSTASFVSVGGGPPDEAVSAEIRNHYGLAADPATIRRAAALDNTAQAGVDLIGIPLTPEELEHVRGRLSLDQAVLRGQETLGEQWPEGFAGISIDHPRGGRITVRMAHGAATEADVQSFLPENADVDLRHVTYSLRELYGQSERARELLLRSAGQIGGVPVDAISVNLDRNRLELHVDPSDRDRAHAVLDALESDVALDLHRIMGLDPRAFGVLITPTVAFEPAGNTDFPWAGGQTIGWWLNGHTWDSDAKCSTAFPVRRNGNEGVLSAAHCANNPVQHFATTRAPDYKDVGYNRISYVSGPVGVEATVLGFRAMEPRIWYKTPSNWDAERTVRFGWSDGIAPGVGFHFTAAYTFDRYYNWEGINHFSISRTLGGVSYNYLQEGNACAQTGDSGGPIYSLTPDGGTSYVAAGGIAFAVPASQAGPSCEPSHTLLWTRTSRALTYTGSSLLTG